MRSSLDFISKLEANLFNCIITDFHQLTVIQLHSDKCGPKEMIKLEEAIRRGNKKAHINDFMNKTD